MLVAGVVGAGIALVFVRYGVATGRFGAGLGGIALFVSYLVTIYLYAALAMLAYRRRYLVFWLLLPPAVAVSMAIAAPWSGGTVIAEWLMPFLAGLALGGLLRRTGKAAPAYTVGVVTVAVLSAVWTALQWDVLQEAVRQVGDSLAETVEIMTADGERFDSATGERVRIITAAVGRLLPSLFMVNHLAQYSLGGLAFFVMVARHDPAAPRPAPFWEWRIPFGVMVLIPLAVAARFLLGETAALLADNLLAVLSVFYSVTGLALLEYGLRRIRLSPPLKVVVYILLLPAGLAGYLALSLAGLAESFFDWRHLRGPQESLDNSE